MSMHGFRVHSPASFSELYAGVFPHVSGLTWLGTSESFQLPYAWGEESAYDDETDRHVTGPAAEFERVVQYLRTRTPWGGTIEHGCIATEDIFPRFAEAVSDDWSSIYGVARRVDDPQAWLEAYYASHVRHEYLSAQCEIIFLSVDGAFREIFAHAPLLSVCEQHLRATGVRYEPCLLSQCDYL